MKNLINFIINKIQKYFHYKYFSFFNHYLVFSFLINILIINFILTIFKQFLLNQNFHFINFLFLHYLIKNFINQYHT